MMYAVHKACLALVATMCVTTQCNASGDFPDRIHSWIKAAKKSTFRKKHNTGAEFVDKFVKRTIASDSTITEEKLKQKLNHAALAMLSPHGNDPLRTYLNDFDKHGQPDKPDDWYRFCHEIFRYLCPSEFPNAKAKRLAQSSATSRSPSRSSSPPSSSRSSPRSRSATPSETSPQEGKDPQSNILVLEPMTAEETLVKFVKSHEKRTGNDGEQRAEEHFKDLEAMNLERITNFINKLDEITVAKDGMNVKDVVADFFRQRMDDFSDNQIIWLDDFVDAIRDLAADAEARMLSKPRVVDVAVKEKVDKLLQGWIQLKHDDPTGVFTRWLKNASDDMKANLKTRCNNLLKKGALSIDWCSIADYESAQSDDSRDSAFSGRLSDLIRNILIELQ